MQDCSVGYYYHSIHIQLFRRHGKVVVPVTACTYIKPDNVNEMVAHIKHLIDNPPQALTICVYKLDQADRSTWKDFEPISKLKCGITKAKLTALKEVFYLSPPAPPELPPPAPETVSIKKASRDEIFIRLKYLSDYKISGFDKVDLDKAADAIFTTSKSKWKSLTPVSNLECGIDKVKTKTLKTVFSL